MIVKAGDFVHVKCHNVFINKNYISVAQKSAPGSSGFRKRKRRSSEDAFDSKQRCLYCDKEIKIYTKTKKHKGHDVQTQDFEKKLRELIAERKDQWAIEVLGRLEAQSDCFAAANCYHHKCDSDFRFGKNPIHHLKGKLNERGRPISDKRVAAFEAALGHLEETDEVMTVKDLKQYMKNALEGTDESAYSETTIR